MSSPVKISALHKRYGALEVLKGITLTVEQGRVAALIGSSGSGKTTLLRCINGLTRFDQGRIDVEESFITPDSTQAQLRDIRKKAGYVFQQFNLWPHKTVLENLILAPMLVKKVTKNEAVEKAQIFIKQVGLEDKINEYPSRLSGGQQQRVAIARALAMEPNVLLLDEITSALDPELVDEVLRVVRRIAEEHRRTLLIVTHEMAFARDVADEVFFMDKGVVLEHGKPAQIFTEPAEERTRQFLKRTLS